MSLTSYILYADLQLTAAGAYGWRFILESLDGATAIEASDTEPNTTGERLELLAVVRGLEALAEPASVYLVTPSRYVTRGLRFGLEAWRKSSWRWERFGHMVPIKNADLWQRLDRALTYHEVKCRRAPQRAELAGVADRQSA